MHSSVNLQIELLNAQSALNRCIIALFVCFQYQLQIHMHQKRRKGKKEQICNLLIILFYLFP